MYITAASTISHQPTFRNKGFSSALNVLARSSEILHPDYSSFIPGMNRRRMSDVLKMAITCAADCLEQGGLKQPEAIVVGTSMGCNNFTKQFLDKIISTQEGLVSPTSFMLSTHNTIAGQISLFLGNQEYNMTHTQNSLSFEQALIDAILCSKEGCSHVLVGASDETGNELYNMDARLNIPDILTTCGASFFILYTEKPDTPSIRLADVGSYGLIDDLFTIISDFLRLNHLTANDIDMVMYSCNDKVRVDKLGAMFYSGNVFNYEKISGSYFTSSAFAMHLGADILSNANHPLFGHKIRKILICNNLIPENLGLILMDTIDESDEAHG